MFAIRETVRNGAAWALVGLTSFVGAGLATAGGVIWLNEQMPLPAALAIAAAIWVLLPLLFALYVQRDDHASSHGTVQDKAPQSPRPHYGTLLLAASAGLAMARGKTEDAAKLFREMDPE